jgi:uncharacterized OB-fold protein
MTEIIRRPSPTSWWGRPPRAVSEELRRQARSCKGHGVSETSIPTTTVEMPYVRTLGPVMSRFFTGLRDGEIWANKTRSGTVQCPPFEYDPSSGAEASDDWVQLAGTGAVTTWAWIEEPLRNHLLQEPFAFCMIRLDGADTDLLHAVRVGSKDQMSTGMRVSVRWRDDRVGSINDIECFEPEAGQ